MRPKHFITTFCLVLVVICFTISVTHAGGIGQVKNMKGSAFLERNRNQVPLKVGDSLQQADKIRTGLDGSVGIIFVDNSSFSVGPNTVFTVDQFAFDSTTHEGVFNTSLRQGTLAVKSGKIVKQTPEAMKINTRSSVLMVRGTRFVVSSGY
ncbi:MAG: FecR domain-containing protein [Magnetococcus sp. YQC-5]